MLSSIKNMLDNFEKYDIKYCQWKSNEHVKEALDGDTDLDILFLPEQRSELEMVLGLSGLKRFRAVPLMQYNAIEDYIGFDMAEAKIWHLHLHYRLTLGEKHLKGYTLPWTNYIVDRRFFSSEGIYTSNPSDECFLLYLRMALKLRKRDYGKKIGEGDLRELNWLKERCTKEDVVKTAESLVGSQVSVLVGELYDTELKKKKQLYKLQRLLRKNMKYYTAYSGMSSYCTRTKRELFWLIGGIIRRTSGKKTKPYRRISPSGGAVVAILGSDGAGKSTTIKYLKKEFGKKIDVYECYMGSGDGDSSLLRKPMKVIAKKIGGKGIGQSVEKEEKSNKKKSLKRIIYNVGRIVWAYVLAIEKRGKLKKVTRARNNGMLVLVDRYPQIEVNGIGDGPLLNKFIKSKGLAGHIARKELRIYQNAYLNKPDMLIKLMAPTEVALERKPGMTAEEINKKIEVVKLIHCGVKEKEIDSSQDKSVTFGQAMEAIWGVI